MVENRQALADAPPTAGDIFRRPKSILRHWMRAVVFAVPALRRLAEKEPASPADTMAHWNGLMSQTHFSTYLGGTITVDATNALSSILIKYHATENPAVLDVGCSGGTMALALPAFSRYVGTDVSSYAIGVANDEPAFAADIASGRVAFLAADLRSFVAEPGAWDVIIFNEVLYYLKTGQALDEVRRYAAALRPGGILCIAMKNDPKSHAIFRLLTRHFHWIDGFVRQRKVAGPDFSIQVDREVPALMIGVFRV